MPHRKLSALWKLYRLPKETVDAFMKSYDLFEDDIVTDNDSKIVDYYSVLNHLCAIGDVEKMYIPPIIDPKVGIKENQILFERKMIDDIGLGHDSNSSNFGFRVLDVGCGRGRIAHHVQKVTGATVFGLNIDRTQIESAKDYARQNNLDEFLFFTEGNYNERLPYVDNNFDALYQVQALTYAKNMDDLCKEMYRVLKPRGKLSFLEWVKLDNFNPTDPHHQDLLKKIKPLIGAVSTPSPTDLISSLEKAGFKILFSGDISLEGHQTDLIIKAKKYFEGVGKWIKFLTTIKLLPRHIKILFDRFNKDGDAFIEADQLKLFTTSYQIVAQKPE